MGGDDLADAARFLSNRNSTAAHPAWQSLYMWREIERDRELRGMGALLARDSANLRFMKGTNVAIGNAGKHKRSRALRARYISFKRERERERERETAGGSGKGERMRGDGGPEP